MYDARKKFGTFTEYTHTQLPRHTHTKLTGQVISMQPAHQHPLTVNSKVHLGFYDTPSGQKTVSQSPYGSNTA